MRVSKWMMAAALLLASPLLYADNGDNERNRGLGGLGQGQGGVPAQGGGQGQAQPQGQQRFPTAGATGNSQPRPSRHSAPRSHAPRQRSANQGSASRAAAGQAPAQGPTANAASHIQKRPHGQASAGRAKASAGPTSNIPGVGANRAGKPDLSAQRAAGRQKLASLGVRAAPHPISNRSSMVRSSAEQSRVTAPSHGPDNRALPTRQVDLRHFSGAGMGARIQGLSSGSRMAGFGRMNAEEREPGRYYWHDDGGQRYCHYMDPWGYQWYGWYGDDDVLWVRYYGDRWWNYDAEMGRWLFWDDGQWWWQDDDGGGVYVYVDGGYILD
ncbi:MAG TPA: hypothetical protein VNZ67_11780 [bacterium]|nr:hypothetical protein [bacterium]